MKIQLQLSDLDPKVRRHYEEKSANIVAVEIDRSIVSFMDIHLEDHSVDRWRCGLNGNWSFHEQVREATSLSPIVGLSLVSFRYHIGSDPYPKLLVFTEYEHGNTKNTLLSGININYLSQEEVDELSQHTAAMVNLTPSQRYDYCQTHIPSIIRKGYRTYNWDHITEFDGGDEADESRHTNAEAESH